MKHHSAAIDGLEHISQLVRRYAEVEKIYLQVGDLIDTQDLEAEMTKLYKRVLEYEATATCQFNRSPAIWIARNIVEADDWGSIFERLKTLDMACAKFIEITDAKDHRHGRRNLENFLAEQDIKIEELLRNAREQDESDKMLLSEQQNWRQTDEERSCHQILRTSGYERHKDRNPDRVEGTCVWFLKHTIFKNWLESEDSSLLWVSADPGSAKPVLSKSLIDIELESTSSRTTCYFLQNDAPDQWSTSKALCALLHQLFSLKPVRLKYALPAFRENKDKMCGLSSLLWEVLEKATADPETGEVICVVDALDECE